MFEKFDVDGDGVVSRREMRAGLASFGVQLSDDDMDALISFYDSDHSGQARASKPAPMARVPCELLAT